jgi:YidC/Oxa1 family membrane protein insertase
MYNEFIFRPLYNGLVGILDFVPGIDVGMAVIIFTVIIRLILFPLYKHSLLAQVKMKEVEPELNKIKLQYADNRQVQGVKIMEFYKKNDIHPFRSLLLPIIQLPILLGIISVFYKIIPTVQVSLLYSFIHIPVIKPTFLGFSLTTKSLVLSLFTAIIQFLQLRFSIIARQQRAVAATTKASNPDKEPTVADTMNSMNTQMQFLIPIVAFVSIYWLIPARFPQAASIVALYWSTSTLFTLGQELYIRKKFLNKKQ